MAITSTYAASPYTGTHQPDFGWGKTFANSAVEAFATGIGGTLTRDALVAYHDRKAKAAGDTLSEERFNALGYGDGGLIHWTPGMSQMGAELRFRFAVEQQMRQYRTAGGSTSANLVGSAVGTMAHPVDFAVGMLAPEFGFSKVASSVYRLGAKEMGRVMSRGAIAGFSQAAIETPVFYYSEPYLQSGMSEKDALLNLVTSPVAGAGLGTLFTGARVQMNPAVTRMRRSALKAVVEDLNGTARDPASVWLSLLNSDPKKELPRKALNHAEMRRLLRKKEFSGEDYEAFARFLSDNGEDALATTIRANVSSRVNASVVDELASEALDRPLPTALVKAGFSSAEEVATLVDIIQKELLQEVLRNNNESKAWWEAFKQKFPEDYKRIFSKERTAGENPVEEGSLKNRLSKEAFGHFINYYLVKHPEKLNNDFSGKLAESLPPSTTGQQGLSAFFKDMFNVELRWHPTLTSSGRVFTDQPGILFIKSGMGAQETVKAATHEFMHSLRLRDSKTYKAITDFLAGSQKNRALNQTVLGQAAKEIREAYASGKKMDKDLSDFFMEPNASTVTWSRDTPNIVAYSGKLVAGKTEKDLVAFLQASGRDRVSVRNGYHDLWSQLTPDRQFDEIVSEAVAKLSERPEFWRELYRQKPRAFRRLVEFFQNLLRKLRGSTDPELDAMAKHVAGILSNASRSLKKDPLFSAPVYSAKVFDRLESRLMGRDSKSVNKALYYFDRLSEEVQSWSAYYPHGEGRWVQTRDEVLRTPQTVDNFQAFLRSTKGPNLEDSGVTFWYKGEKISNKSKGEVTYDKITRENYSSEQGKETLFDTPVTTKNFQKTLREESGPEIPKGPKDMVTFWYQGKPISPDTKGKVIYDRITRHRYEGGGVKAKENLAPEGDSLSPEIGRNAEVASLKRAAPFERIKSTEEYFSIVRSELLKKAKRRWEERHPGEDWASSKAKKREEERLNSTIRKNLVEEARRKWEKENPEENWEFSSKKKEVERAVAKMEEDLELEAVTSGLMGTVEEELGIFESRSGSKEPFFGYRKEAPDFGAKPREIAAISAKQDRMAWKSEEQFRKSILSYFYHLLFDETVTREDLASDMARLEALSNDQLYEVAANVVSETNGGRLGQNAETYRAIDKALTSAEKPKDWDALDMKDYQLLQLQDSLTDEESIFNQLGNVMDGALDRPLMDTANNAIRGTLSRTKSAFDWVAKKTAEVAERGYRHTGYDERVLRQIEQEGSKFASRAPMPEELNSRLWSTLGKEDSAAVEELVFQLENPGTSPNVDANGNQVPPAQARFLSSATVSKIAQRRVIQKKVTDVFSSNPGYLATFGSFAKILDTIDGWDSSLFLSTDRRGVSPYVRKKIAFYMKENEKATVDQTITVLYSRNEITKAFVDQFDSFRKQGLSPKEAYSKMLGEGRAVSVELYQRIHSRAAYTGKPLDVCLSEILARKTKVRENQFILQDLAILKMREQANTPDLLRTFLDGNRRRDGFSGTPLPSAKAGKRNRQVIAPLGAIGAKHPGLLDDFFGNSEVTERVLNYLASDKEGSPDITDAEIELANALEAVHNLQATEMNNLGAEINPVRGYVLCQLWVKTRGKSLEEFVAAAEEAFDWRRMDMHRGGVDEKGETNQWLSDPGEEGAVRRKDYLEGLYDWVTKEGWKEGIDPNLSSFNLARQNSYSRSVFLLPEHTFSWDMNFGSGNPAQTIISGMQRRADQIACLELLGPDLEATYNGLISSYPKGWLSKDKWSPIDHATFRQVVGELDAPVNPDLALKARAVRNVGNMVFLEGAGLNSVVDVATGSALLRYHGIPVGVLNRKFFSRYLAAIKRGVKSHHVMLNAVGAGADQLMSNFSNRITGESDMLTSTGKLVNFMFYINGMNTLTKAAQEAVVQLFSEALGSGDLNIARFARYGFTPEDMELMRGMAKEVEGLQGKHCTPTDLREAGRPDLAEKLEGFYHHVMTEGSITPDPRSQAESRLGTKAGTWKGEAAREAMRFIGFPLAMVNKTWRRIKNGYGDSFWDAFKDPKSRVAVETIGFVGSMLAMGYVVTALKDIAAGREPMMLDDMSPASMRRVVAASGLAGPLDLLLGRPGGFAGFFGPTAGSLAGIGEAALGVEGAPSAGTLALRNTPGMDLPIVGPAAQHLLAYVFGDSVMELQSALQRREDYYTQEFGAEPIFE